MWRGSICKQGQETDAPARGGCGERRDVLPAGLMGQQLTVVLLMVRAVSKSLVLSACTYRHMWVK